MKYRWREASRQCLVRFQQMHRSWWGCEQHQKRLFRLDISPPRFPMGFLRLAWCQVKFRAFLYQYQARWLRFHRLVGQLHLDDWFVFATTFPKRGQDPQRHLQDAQMRRSWRDLQLDQSRGFWLGIVHRYLPTAKLLFALNQGQSFHCRSQHEVPWLQFRLQLCTTRLGVWFDPNSCRWHGVARRCLQGQQTHQTQRRLWLDRWQRRFVWLY